jgi:prepilin-type N-terminal cleavage/methylation domain-containing protein
MKKLTKIKGFTLIEILVVIGIIAILATIVIIAINPARQFAQARDTQRVSSVNTILNAIGQRMADNKGIFAGLNSANGLTCPDLPNIATAVGTTLDCLVPTYVTIIPTDPNPNTALPGGGGYMVVASSTGRITVSAPSAEINTPVSVTR